MDLASEELNIRHTGDPLSADEAGELVARLTGGWSADDGKLRRTYSFENFAEALAFVNRVGELAEASDHHPLITFTWGKVEIEIWTHSIGGLQRADFVWAARADQLI